MQKRSRRITDVANSMLGLRWCIGAQDISDTGLVHQGVRPELICRNREQVIDMVGRRAGRVPPVEAIGLIAAGDHG
jgi:hypothetical protein